MKSTLNPGQWDTTELNITEGLFFSLEGYAFCFAFGRIFVRTKFQIVLCYILFTGCQHLLERVKRGGKDEIIITIPKDSSKDITHPASGPIPSENSEEIVGVKTAENT